jgi:hypothetical protein
MLLYIVCCSNGPLFCCKLESAISLFNGPFSFSDLDHTLYPVASDIDLEVMKFIEFQGTYINQTLLVLLNIYTSTSQFAGRDEYLVFSMSGVDTLVLLFDSVWPRLHSFENLGVDTSGALHPPPLQAPQTTTWCARQFFFHPDASLPAPLVASILLSLRGGKPLVPLSAISPFDAMYILFGAFLIHGSM